MTPSRPNASAMSADVPGWMPAWLPFRSVGPLPGSNSAAASRSPGRCAGTCRVPWAATPSDSKVISRSVAGTPLTGATVAATRAATSRMCMGIPFSAQEVGQEDAEQDERGGQPEAGDERGAVADVDGPADAEPAGHEPRRVGGVAVEDAPDPVAVVVPVGQSGVLVGLAIPVAPHHDQ